MTRVQVSLARQASLLSSMCLEFRLSSSSSSPSEFIRVLRERNGHHNKEIIQSGKKIVTSKTFADCALLRPDVERHHCFGAREGLETQQWPENHIDKHTTPPRSSSRWKCWEPQSPPCNGSRTTWRFSAAIGSRFGKRRMEALWLSERPGWAIHPWPQIFLGI